jgi:hypothetical protein
MKKFILTFMMFAMFAVMLPLSTNAQTYYRQYYRNGRVYTSEVYGRPSYYRRHRNRINMAIGTGAGALVGGLIGGGRGAGIGALAGLGGSALYSYKLHKKHRHYVKVYNY